MALSLSDFYANTCEKYKISMLAGSDSLASPVSWMYLMEDIGNCSFIRGGELVITTGLDISNADALLDFVIRVKQVGACGILINLGNYLTDIPGRVIHWCSAHSFPLFSMPWEIHIADLMQYFCSLIMNDSSQQEKRSAVMRRLISGLDADIDIPLIQDGFIIASSDETTAITSYWGKCRIDGLYYYAIGNTSNMPKLTSGHCGISDRFIGSDSISSAAGSARRALMCSLIMDIPLQYSHDNGLYDIALGIAESSGYHDVCSHYVNLISPLTNETTACVFRSYLENNCSINRVAETLYLHRNTVNYHVQKAKSMLPEYNDSMLCSYLLAFYIKDSMEVLK